MRVLALILAGLLVILFAPFPVLLVMAAIGAIALAIIGIEVWCVWREDRGRWR